MRKASSVEGLARRAKEAARTLARTPTAVKDKALREMARAIRRTSGSILRVNRSEVAAARAAGKPAAFLDRLALDEKRIESIAQGLLRVAQLPDPVGKTEDFSIRPNGLKIRKMRVPLGVIAVIYESRPGVTADAAGLCLKSGNACILRGGSEAARTNTLIADALAAGLKAAGLPAGSVGFLRDRDRSAVR
ncbi:MAG: aldehyde dehydrogenase family protein, partial [Elusimicrobiota bacterium]